MRKKILLIEDDKSLRGLLVRLLAARGYEVLAAGTGEAGLRAARAERPDLVLTDWVLGRGIQGVEVCERLKSAPATRAIPIVVMSGARVEFDDELLALRRGADLYLQKKDVVGGSGEDERFYRYVESLLQRPYDARAPRRAAGAAPELEIDLAAHTVRTRHELIEDLPTRLFDVLYMLALKHPEPVSRVYLVSKVWRNAVRDREADVAISRLKDRIEVGRDRLIESVVGKGWRLLVEPAIRL